METSKHQMIDGSWDYEERSLFNVPLPARTETYEPISHRQIITGIRRVLDDRGMYISSRAYTVNSGGNRLTGTMTADLRGSQVDSEMRMMIGFMNSYDKSMTVGLAIGSRIMVCSNGMILGGVLNFKRKHTGSVQQELEETINSVAEKLGETYEMSINLKRELSEIQLDKRQMAELAGIAYFEKGILGDIQGSIVRKEIENPSFDQFKEPNGWSFYNHCTYALKRSYSMNYLKDHSDLTDFVTDELLDIEQVN